MRFFGNHAGTRQIRGSRKVKPASNEERLESMRAELLARIILYGDNHPLTRTQRYNIAKLIKERGENNDKG